MHIVITKQFINRLLDRKVTFLAVFFVVFSVSYLLLLAIDFVPEPIDATTKVDEAILEEDSMLPLENTTAPEGVEIRLEYPEQIYIEKIDKVISVLNPTSREVVDLDRALLSGTVRHPDSALLGQEGNVFILGHSSYLPTVFNQNFKAFNGIQNLEWGDTIEVTSDNSVYIYRVDKVYRAEAGELVVPIAGDKKKLTLATCDSFGDSSARFIVEATQVELKTL